MSTGFSRAPNPAIVRRAAVPGQTLPEAPLGPTSCYWCGYGDGHPRGCPGRDMSSDAQVAFFGKVRWPRQRLMATDVEVTPPMMTAADVRIKGSIDELVDGALVVKPNYPQVHVELATDANGYKRLRVLSTIEEFSLQWNCCPARLQQHISGGTRYVVGNDTHAKIDLSYPQHADLYQLLVADAFNFIRHLLRSAASGETVFVWNGHQMTCRPIAWAWKGHRFRVAALEAIAETLALVNAKPCSFMRIG